MDQAIKLFGRTIPFSQTHEILTTSYPDKSQFMDSSIDITKAEVKSHNSENSKEPDKLPTKSKHNIETEVHPTSKQEQLESSTSSDQEKTFKKPDKILSCPRCNSFDTKFCYFNNYNVNQPRHFCKKCQRYWTAGGTVRNVPIGAGRRKNKHLASQFHLITASTNGVSQTGFESTNSSNQQLLPCGESSSNGNVTVLRFGPEVPLCDDSTATRVSSYEKSKRCIKMHSVNSSENGHESSYRSPLTKALTTQENESSQCATKAKHFGLQGPCNETRMFNPLHYCPVPPLVIPWNNPTGNNVTSCGGASHCYHQNFVPNGSGLNQVQCYPLQFVSTGHWGSIPMCAAPARPGNIPLIGSFACFSPSSISNGGYSGNGSPTLGKHCRDANFIDEEKLENCVWVPKVRRTDDTDEA